MAKVKITGHASGTGTITLTAPNTSTDRTITLPDGDISLGVGIDDNATSTAITIDSSENVGIGTASPNGVLNVVQASNTSALLRLRNNSADTSTADGMIFTIDNASSPVGSIEMVSGGSDAKLAFRTNGAERMRIDSSGNAGLGVTPESSYASRPTLRIGSGLAIGGYGSGNPSHHWINANAYQDASTAAEKYIGTDQASQIKQTNGTIAFNVAPNGTAGAAITWDNAMVIDNDGHVGIGYSAVNGILDVRESWASKWAARFENTSATGLGILCISAATSGAYSLLELRKNETTQVLNIRADGKAISQFTAAAWVSIDGVGTVGINDSYNISSITDNGTGLYTINIDTNMLNSDYCVTAMCQGTNYSSAFASGHGTMSTGSFPIRVRSGDNSVYKDADEVMLTIFGDQ